MINGDEIRYWWGISVKWKWQNIIIFHNFKKKYFFFNKNFFFIKKSLPVIFFVWLKAIWFNRLYTADSMLSCFWKPSWLLNVFFSSMICSLDGVQSRHCLLNSNCPLNLLIRNYDLYAIKSIALISALMIRQLN